MMVAISPGIIRMAPNSRHIEVTQIGEGKPDPLQCIDQHALDLFPS